MTFSPLNWVTTAVLVPLLGAVYLSRVPDGDAARRRAFAVALATLLATLAAWFADAPTPVLDPAGAGGTRPAAGATAPFAVDSLNAPLLPLVALVYLLTLTATLRTKVRRFSFAWTLLAEGLALATFAAKNPWLIAALMTASCVPPYRELRVRGKSTAVFVVHLGASALLLFAGLAWAGVPSAGDELPAGATALVLAAVLIRAGAAPFHCWITDLFEHGTFGGAMTFVLPMTGAYAALRLLAPAAPDWALRAASAWALATAVYAAGMTLVQRDARRFFAFIVISHAALALVGMEMFSPIGLTGGLCVWLSAMLALSGFGLTLRAIESRTGRLSLDAYHGLYEHMPTLASFFLLTGLAGVGFPGTFGFIGSEMLVDAAVTTSYATGFAVAAAAAFNGVAVLQAYFRLFAGAHRSATISLGRRPRERFAVLTLAALIVGGGMWPQPGAASRYRAAEELLSRRVRGAAVQALRDAQPPHVDQASRAAVGSARRRAALESGAARFGKPPAGANSRPGKV